MKFLSKASLILSIFTLSVNATSHHPEVFLKSIQDSPQVGKEIYTHFCSNCHARKALIRIGAPRYRIHTDWDQRLKQGIESLFHHTDEGLNAMPARGGCFECTDEQLMLAMIYMLPKKSQKELLNKLLDYKKDI
ncbi:MAG: cytochrome c5 family protein [Legionella sp.]|nr:cytochrome c5 family protein [Legionella sp.]